MRSIDRREYPAEDDLRLVWRLYILGQIWKAVETYIKDHQGAIDEAIIDEARTSEKALKKYGLIYEYSGLKSAFAFAIAKARALNKLAISWKEGVEFGFDKQVLYSGHSYEMIPLNNLLKDLDLLVGKLQKNLWIALDRLDEIILGDQKLENLVLKGLLLAYRELADLQNIRIKMFLRDDVFSRVTKMGHFPALTHVRSRTTPPINWTDEDLLDYIVRRLNENASVRQLVDFQSLRGSKKQQRRTIFYTIFPAKIDRTSSSKCFDWICDRLKDGNGVITPRDLLSVVERSRINQLEVLERDDIVPPDRLLFNADSIIRAIKSVAWNTLEDKIFAEYPELREPILCFKGSSTNHNDETLQKTLGKHYREEIIEKLLSIGFIYHEELRGITVWSIPYFYGVALDVRQGPAFDIDQYYYKMQSDKT